MCHAAGFPLLSCAARLRGLYVLLKLSDQVLRREGFSHGIISLIRLAEVDVQERIGNPLRVA